MRNTLVLCRMFQTHPKAETKQWFAVIKRLAIQRFILSKKSPTLENVGLAILAGKGL